MGRDAFLTRLALGRSAYEAPERFPTGSRLSGYADGEASARVERPPQYDSRGHPINPQARALGRVLRDSQNDVLAAVGVVERKRVRIASATSLPPPKDPEIIKQVEAENLTGTLIAIVGTLTKYAGIWWVSALLDRILTYDYPVELSFTELVGGQYRSAGPVAFFFAGLPAQLVSMLTNDGDLWADLAISALDDAVIRSKPSRKRKLLFQRWRPRLRKIISISIELIFAPIVLHAGYQRLFLTSAAQFLPSTRMFNPFLTASSSVMTLPFPLRFSVEGLLNLASGIATSPIVLIIGWRRAMIHIQRVMYEPLEKGILAPDNPDAYTTDETTERKRTTILLARNRRLKEYRWTSWFFGCLNWNRQGEALADGTVVEHGPADAPVVEALNTDDNSPRTPAESSSSSNDPQTPPGPPPHSFPTPPMSPTESFRNPEDDRDATVRIASRNERSGVVSLEIALPEELQNTVGAGRNQAERQRTRESFNEQHGRHHCPIPKRMHRVTELAEEPAEMLGSWINFTFSDWILLPVKAVGLRMIAQSYLRTAGTRNHGLSSSMTHAVYSPWPNFSGIGFNRMGVNALGVYIGRVALCCALETCVGLATWSLECFAVTLLGKKYFSWGQRR